MSDRVAQLTKAIDDLKADVAAEQTVNQSAIKLIQGFAQRLQDAIAAAQAQGVQLEQIQSLTDLHTALSSQTGSLADAVTAGTPADTTGTELPPAPAQ